MPLISTRGAASVQGLGMFSAVSGPFWITTLGDGAAGAEDSRGITVDANNNVYIAGWTPVSTNNNFLIAAFNKASAIQWQRTLGGSAVDLAAAVAVDASQNIYVAGLSANAGSNDAILAKYNSSGVIQWQRALGVAGVTDAAQGVVVDSAGDIYISGYTAGSGAGSTDILIAKYNSSGTLQWQRVLGGVDADTGQGIAIDSSSNVYVVSYAVISADTQIILCKYNSSGVIQWQRSLAGPGTADLAYSVAVDSSSNVCIVGRSSNPTAGGTDVVVAQYNTSGTLQWQRRLGGSGGDIGYGIAVDAASNIYISGVTASAGAGNNDALIAKYDSSGVIQWQRTLGTSSFDNAYAAATRGDAVYIAGTTTVGSSSDVLLAKLPSNGSKTGTYGSFVYQSSSLTEVAGGLTSSTSTLTDAAGTLTGSTPTLTDATSSLTVTVITL